MISLYASSPVECFSMVCCVTFWFLKAHTLSSMLPVCTGLEQCVFNVHLLTHLAHFVRQFGPLWSHSCFSFENANGSITSLIHGSQHVNDQVGVPDCNMTGVCIHTPVHSYSLIDTRTCQALWLSSVSIFWRKTCTCFNTLLFALTCTPLVVMHLISPFNSVQRRSLVDGCCTRSLARRVHGLRRRAA